MNSKKPEINLAQEYNELKAEFPDIRKTIRNLIFQELIKGNTMSEEIYNEIFSKAKMIEDVLKVVKQYDIVKLLEMSWNERHELKTWGKKLGTIAKRLWVEWQPEKSTKDLGRLLKNIWWDGYDEEYKKSHERYTEKRKKYKENCKNEIKSYDIMELLTMRHDEKLKIRIQGKSLTSMANLFWTWWNPERSAKAMEKLLREVRWSEYNKEYKKLYEKCVENHKDEIKNYNIVELLTMKTYEKKRIKIQGKCLASMAMFFWTGWAPERSAKAMEQLLRAVRWGEYDEEYKKSHERYAEKRKKYIEDGKEEIKNYDIIELLTMKVYEKRRMKIQGKSWNSIAKYSWVWGTPEQSTKAMEKLLREVRWDKYDEEYKKSKTRKDLEVRNMFKAHSKEEYIQEIKKYNISNLLRMSHKIKRDMEILDKTRKEIANMFEVGGNPALRKRHMYDLLKKIWWDELEQKLSEG